MSSLVAYASSDENDSSDEETPTELVKDSSEATLRSPSAGDREDGSNLPISDDDDEIMSSKFEAVKGLQLPPPKLDAQTSKNEESQSKGSLFLSGLPKPKADIAPVKFTDENEGELEDFVRVKPQKSDSAQKPVGTGDRGKKRKTVLISVPEVSVDSDDESETLKRKKPAEGKCGLFAILPAPKNVAQSKEQGKMFMPQTISKNKLPAASESSKGVQNLPTPQVNQATKKPQDVKLKSNVFIPASLTRKTPQSSQSAFNLETGMMMVKSKKRQGTGVVDRQGNEGMEEMKQPGIDDAAAASNSKSLPGVPTEVDSDDDDEGSSTTNFFSLGGNLDGSENALSSQSLVATASVSTLPGVSRTGSSAAAAREPDGDPTAALQEPLTFSETAGPETQDAPLQFKKTVQPYQAYGQYGGAELDSRYQAGTSYSQQYNLANVEQEEEQGVEGAGQVAGTASGDFLQDQEFLKMQGKSKRGKEEINFIDVRQDDQIHDVDVMKTISEESNENQMSYSKKKNKDMPSSQQKRKHQITYLAFRAKERELELKNQWADNRATKRQSQAKYGF